MDRQVASQLPGAVADALVDPLFNPDCDFAGDASVDVVDLLTLVETFGERL